LFSILFVACDHSEDEFQQTSQTLEFGESIAQDLLMSNDDFRSLVKKEATVNCVISGTIIAICDDSACDFKLTMFDGRDINVKLDPSLQFIAKNKINQSIILSGEATIDASKNDAISFLTNGIKIIGTKSDKE
jgi:hypothetical protein